MWSAITNLSENVQQITKELLEADEVEKNIFNERNLQKSEIERLTKLVSSLRDTIAAKDFLLRTENQRSKPFMLSEGENDEDETKLLLRKAKILLKGKINELNKLEKVNIEKMRSIQRILKNHSIILQEFNFVEKQLEIAQNSVTIFCDFIRQLDFLDLQNSISKHIPQPAAELKFPVKILQENMQKPFPNLIENIEHDHRKCKVDQIKLQKIIEKEKKNVSELTEKLHECKKSISELKSTTDVKIANLEEYKSCQRIAEKEIIDYELQKIQNDRNDLQKQLQVAERERDLLVSREKKLAAEIEKLKHDNDHLRVSKKRNLFDIESQQMSLYTVFNIRKFNEILRRVKIPVKISRVFIVAYILFLHYCLYTFFF